ncbi:beta strand repeat-containing protein [Serratia sp. NPDC087055]|uniref:beta strand repeat-containing protein n=1 Tax=Serratia sp. NPDC087055 TaxID=3364516 RepID=UPI0038512092
MASQVLYYQKEVAAILYAVLGQSTYTGANAFDSAAGQIRTGQITTQDYIGGLISSSAGQALYASKSSLEILKTIYTQAYGSSPADAVLQNILNTTSLNDAVFNAIDGLLHYKGFDSGTLASQSALENHTDAMLYSGYGSAAWNQWSVALSSQEEVASVYLASAYRGIDAGGLGYWTNYLIQPGKTFQLLIKNLLSSSEFQQKGANLTGDAFIQHVYNGIYGTDASAAVLAVYRALGTDKTVITQAIINDLRSSTATDAATVTSQHAYEYAIGTSLVYKTAAALTATASGGNATGTINNGLSHQISNAETAVLTDVQLNANAASVVNLKFADHLANLTINGTSAATVNLSDNGVNPGVDVTVNNGNIILNASSGSDDVVVTSTANIATGTAKFNLGAGNDSLQWAGNGVANGANTVAAAIKADGGSGIDSISANFITKSVVTNQNALGIRTSAVTSNANNFSNFEQIDLTGYIGKSVGTLITTPLIGSPTTTSVTTPIHVFDFGLTNGTATVEGTTGGTVTQGAAATNLGAQGFVISGLANASVINAAGGTAAQLEVKGDATSASTLSFTFVQNATDHFNINFDAVSSANVNAGAISLNSSSSALLGTALGTVNIASGGTGAFNNIMSLAGTNAQVQTINVTGDHALNLAVGSGFSNVRDINASTNTGGLNLDSSHAGTGDGIIVQLLNALPLSAVTTALLTPLLNTLGLNGYQLTVEGSTTADSFNILGNTTLTGGAGANTYDLKSSNTQAGVTITDFSTAKDKIVDAASGLTLSNTGTAVGDYGTRSADTLDALLGSLVGGLTTGVVGLLGGILGLSNPNSLTSKVGVASVVFSGTGNNADSYVIIDNNNNHTLDANDTVVYLTGQNHQQLVDNLHYA